MASRLLVLLQLAAIAALLWPWSATTWNPWGFAPIAIAVALAGWTVTSNPPGNFSVFPEPRANARLITTGAYACVRHPLYVALMIFGLGFCVGWHTALHWLAGAALAVILDVKSRREERFLRERFAAYEAYAAGTPRLVPRWRKHAR